MGLGASGIPCHRLPLSGARASQWLGQAEFQAPTGTCKLGWRGASLSCTVQMLPPARRPERAASRASSHQREQDLTKEIDLRSCSATQALGAIGLMSLLRTRSSSARRLTCLPTFAMAAGTQPSCTFLSFHRFTFHPPPRPMKRHETT